MCKLFRRGWALCLMAAVMMSVAATALAADGKVTADSLNLRKEASTKSKTLQTLDKGDKLNVLSESGSWYKVSYGKYTGYVMKKYVKVTGQVAKEETKTEDKSSSTSTTLRKGSSGTAVKTLQKKLKSLGYYTGSVDGKFGDGTYTALKKFQKKNGLSADGVAGPKTMEKLNSSKAVAAEKTYTTETLNWFGHQNTIPKNAVFTVKDCKTGKTFQVKRWSGANHLDAEPLTAEDTATMKAIYGDWSWDRRAILVKYGDHVYAASMNGMPHGTTTISDNNFDGHFCIHFTGSKTHESNKVDSDHQKAIKTALKYTW